MVDLDRARVVVTSWSDYLREHRDEIAALRVLYDGAPVGRVSYAELRELTDRIKRPPYGWTPDALWKAYESLEAGRVRHGDRHTARCSRLSSANSCVCPPTGGLPPGTPVSGRPSIRPRNCRRPVHRGPSRAR